MKGLSLNAHKPFTFYPSISPSFCLFLSFSKKPKFFDFLKKEGLWCLGKYAARDAAQVTCPGLQPVLSPFR